MFQDCDCGSFLVENYFRNRETKYNLFIVLAQGKLSELVGTFCWFVSNKPWSVRPVLVLLQDSRFAVSVSPEHPSGTPNLNIWKTEDGSLIHSFVQKKQMTWYVVNIVSYLAIRNRDKVRRYE